MGTGLISTGISGIQVAQLGLLTAEHNIANAHTAGYSRQRTIQASNIAMSTGAGYVGQGAHVATVERIYDRFLSGQVNSAQTASSELQTYYTQLTQIDNMLADANSGVSPALQEFFTGIQKVSANPSQLPARQAMLSSAQALVARYQGLESRISEMYESVNGQLATTIGTINSYSKQIAELNDRIVTARASNNQPPNDLLDQRDQLILDLNKLVTVTTTTGSDGTFNVFVGSGQQLVVGTQVSTLEARPSGADPSRFVVGLKTFGGTQELPESLITGGSLGGLLSFRSGSLDRVANDLGRNAASLALTFNAQNALGQDLLGQSIGVGTFQKDFFTLSQPLVIAHTQNPGTATVTATFVSPPPIDGQYTLARNASGAGSVYELKRLSDGMVWQSTDTPPTLATLTTLGTPPVPLSASEGLVLTGVTLNIGESTRVLSPAASGASFYTKLTSSDYRLSYDGTNFTLSNLSDVTKQWATSAVAPIKTLDDLRAEVAGSEGFLLDVSNLPGIAAGDSFIIQPTRTAARNLSVNPSIAADVRLIAAAMPVRTVATSTNTGGGTISEAKSVLGYGTPAFPANGVKLTYSGGNFTLSSTSAMPVGAKVSVTVGNSTTLYDSSASIPFTPDSQVSFAGVSFQIRGIPNDNDTFVLSKNASGVSDGRNALTLGQLQTQNTMSGKTASFQSAYAQMVSDVGNKTREIAVKGEAQNALLKQTMDARDSLSGVNLDEEAASLMSYQQAYQASAKMLDIGNKLFDTLLSIMS